MAAKALEAWNSRDLVVGPESPSAVLRYTVIDADDEDAAIVAIEDKLPALFRGLVFQNYKLTPQGGGIFSAEVEYARKPQNGASSPTDGTGAGAGDPGSGQAGDGDAGSDDAAGDKQPKQPGDGPRSSADWDFGFDTTGGTARIYQFRTKVVGGQTLTTARTIAEGIINKKDYKGAINVKTQGNKDVAEGVEIGVPQFSFTLKGTFRPPLPTGFLLNLKRLSHRVNSDKVTIRAHGARLTFEPGELLFLGATGNINVEGDVPITMQFGCSENEFLTGIIAGAVDDFNNSVTGISKKGFEYIWFRYEEQALDNKFIPKPVQAFVGEVYPTAALAVLLTPFNS